MCGDSCVATQRDSWGVWGGRWGGVLLLETGITSPNTKLHILGRQQQKRRQERDYKTPVTTPAP